MKRKVAVLMGGFSGERDVSLSSGKGVVNALHELGHDVIPIDVTRDIKKFIHEVESSKPDVIVNALHGKWGEDGGVQSILEALNVPYSNSGVLGSVLSMNKVVARDICESKGIRVPKGIVAPLKDVCSGKVMKPPYVIKPIGEGSSLGVYIIKDAESQFPDLENWSYDQNVLVEEYIPGREIQVAVLGGKGVGAIEICPTVDFYNYEAKYTDGKAKHLMPAPIHADIYKQALDWAAEAHNALHCKGISRSDFRYDDTQGEPGLLYYLETNPQPGLTPLSLVPEIVAHGGMDFNQLIQWMVEDALCR